MPWPKSKAGVPWNYGAYKEIEMAHGDNYLAAQRNCNEARKHAGDSVIMTKWRYENIKATAKRDTTIKWKGVL